MEGKFEAIIEALWRDETLVIGDQTFLNEVILDRPTQLSVLSTITFSKIDFEKVNFTGSALYNCQFKNCGLKEVTFQKCNFWKTTFENCQIE